MVSATVKPVMSYMPRINSLKERDSVSGPTAYFLGFPAMCHAMEIRVGRVTIRTCVGIANVSYGNVRWWGLYRE